MASDLPPEVLNIIFSHQSDKAALLKYAQVCKTWAASIYSFYVYKTLKLTTPAALQKCLYVFSYTALNRKFRAQYNWSRLVSRRLGIADQSSESSFQVPYNFYSTRNYGLYVREIDLSELQGKGIVTDREIEQLTNSCPYLRSINLYNCHGVTDSAIEHFATKCPHLENIYLAGLTTLTGSFLQTLRASCPKLRIMNLNLCFNISSPSIIESTENSRLVTLKLNKVILVDQDLLMIAQNCSQTLTTLSLNDCRVTDTTIDEVSRICPNLQHLSISGLGYVHTLNLTRLPSALRTLRIPKNSITTSTVSTILRDARHTLRSIDLSLTDSRIGLSPIHAILNACTSLERVALSRVDLHRDLCLLLHRLADANLSHLTLNRCLVLDHHAFIALLARAAARCLYYLDLSYTLLIPSGLLHTMSAVPGAEKIEVLILSGVQSLGSPTTMRALPKLFPGLRVLGLADLLLVDDATVEVLVGGLKALQVLDLTRCYEVGEEVMQLPTVRRVVEAVVWWKVRDEVW